MGATTSLENQDSGVSGSNNLTYSTHANLILSMILLASLE